MLPVARRRCSPGGGPQDRLETDILTVGCTLPTVRYSLSGILSEVLNRCLRAQPLKNGAAEFRGYGEVIRLTMSAEPPARNCWRLFISSPPSASSIITFLLA